MTTLRVEVLDGPSDPRVSDGEWASLLSGDREFIPSLSREWQSAWWVAGPPRESAWLAVREDRRLVALAPWFVDGGMVFSCGVGTSDALDVLGRRNDAVFGLLLSSLRERWPGLVGLRLHLLPAASPTTDALRRAAKAARLVSFVEDDMVSPVVDLEQDPHVAERTSMRRHEARLRREGLLQVHHLAAADQIAAELPGFFAQHQRRWSGQAGASSFDDPARRRFFELLTGTGGAAGWLRMTRVDLDGVPVAYHLGTYAERRYLWYTPSYEPAFARFRPGEVLLRHVFLQAAREGARVVDLGVGDEPYKRRFATSLPRVLTLAAYEHAALAAR